MPKSRFRQYFLMKVFLELMALVAMMDELDGLFKGDGNEQADDDGGDVNEEVSPGVCGFVGRVDTEHGGLLLVGECWG
jgi:hypothetical protein